MVKWCSDRELGLQMVTLIQMVTQTQMVTLCLGREAKV